MTMEGSVDAIRLFDFEDEDTAALCTLNFYDVQGTPG